MSEPPSSVVTMVPSAGMPAGLHRASTPTAPFIGTFQEGSLLPAVSQLNRRYQKVLLGVCSVSDWLQFCSIKPIQSIKDILCPSVYEGSGTSIGVQVAYINLLLSYQLNRS